MDPRQRFKSDREEEHLVAQAARAGQRRVSNATAYRHARSQTADSGGVFSRAQELRDKPVTTTVRSDPSPPGAVADPADTGLDLARLNRLRSRALASQPQFADDPVLGASASQNPSIRSQVAAITRAVAPSASASASAYDAYSGRPDDAKRPAGDYGRRCNLACQHAATGHGHRPVR